jgi:hypothetical protein
MTKEFLKIAITGISADQNSNLFVVFAAFLSSYENVKLFSNEIPIGALSTFQRCERALGKFLPCAQN